MNATAVCLAPFPVQRAVPRASRAPQGPLRTRRVCPAAFPARKDLFSMPMERAPALHAPLERTRAFPDPRPASTALPAALRRKREAISARRARPAPSPGPNGPSRAWNAVRARISRQTGLQDVSPACPAHRRVSLVLPHAPRVIRAVFSHRRGRSGAPPARQAPFRIVRAPQIASRAPLEPFSRNRDRPLRTHAPNATTARTRRTRARHLAACVSRERLAARPWTRSSVRRVK